MTETKLEIPDLVGDTGRAEIVATAIRDLQGQRVSLDVMQTVADSDDAAIVPGLEMTFAERRAQMDAAIERLAEMNPEAMKLIRESVS